MFFNIGESIPQEHFAKSIKQQSESSSAVISLISSVKLSVLVSFVLYKGVQALSK